MRAELTSAQQATETLRATADSHEAANSDLSAKHGELESRLAAAHADAERLKCVGC